MPTVFVILLLALFFRGSWISGCIESERNALLDFKEGLRDPSNRLSSWNGNDCCNWEGIVCRNKSGHVFRLDLRNLHSTISDFYGDIESKWSLGGEIRPSLLKLKHLRYLDLSMNDFKGSNIPEFIGSIYNLRYLNLSMAGLGGLIPHHLGNLSRLEYLDLSYDGFSIDNCIWISGLFSIKHLIMLGVNFQNSSNLMQSLNMLPSVVEIDLSSCDIDSIPLTHVNFTHLSILDLSGNNINSTLPSWLFNISSLEYLDLSGNSIQGSIPPAIENLNLLKLLMLSNNKLQGGLPKQLGNLCKLRTLDFMGNNVTRGLPELEDIFSGCIKMSIENLYLSQTGLTGYLPDWLGELRLLKTLNLDGNSLEGSIPESIGKLTSLQEVDLSYNKLNGTISESLGELAELVQLDVNMNQLEGIISEAHLDNLTKLQYLDLSYNLRLVLKVSPDWVPRFQLDSLYMSSCNIGPKFPAWIRNQANISFLELANAGIIDAMPDWFWILMFEAEFLDISKNSITGRLPDLVNFVNLQHLHISSNYFYGTLPNFSKTVQDLDLSNNLLSGMIDPAIGERMPNLRYLSLSGNKLNGNVPPSLCQLTIGVLDLSRNLLSGELPNCWNGYSSDTLTILDCSSNNLSGTIPETIGSLSRLEALHLGNNSLSGVVPSSLRGCTNLVTLDLSQNKLTGEVPAWIGDNYSLKFLRLRSNRFFGRIPQNLSRLLDLQILDLANNNLWGKIPMSFGMFSYMKLTRTHMGPILLSNGTNYQEIMEVVMGGRDLTYGDSNEVLSLVTALDLSNNNLSGTIPQELGSLAGLLSLNLSGNILDGEIPTEIGSMHSLVSLDLSRNTLSGAIPSTMGSLTFLADMDLSRNNLSGKIPSGNQFQTFNESSYIGNPGLCGFPLKKACEDDKVLRGGNATVVEDEARSEIWWLYIGLGPGFVAGFWVFCGTLLLKKEWKYALFRFVDRVYDRFYVIVAVTYNRYFRK